VSADHATGDPGEDLRLLEGARKGEERALAQLVERHQGVVYRYLLQFLREEDQAADATQDTFLKAFSKLDAFRGDSSFRTWLLAIARNEALGSIRSHGRRREEVLDGEDRWVDQGVRPDEQAVRADEVDRVRAALARLPEKQRLSVSLRLFDGLSFREIGEATGTSEGAARVNYHYGIGRLREWLDA